MMNPWKILGVHRKSTDGDIRDAYISLARQYHPDAPRANLKEAIKDSERFKVVVEAYRMLKSKAARTSTVAQTELYCDTCQKCKGQGVTSKSKSLTEKTYKACVACGGSGFIIEATEEIENDVIELQSTDGPSRKGRNKKR